MTKAVIIRAWKDPEFRASLSAEERAALPENPTGSPMNELDEADLGHAIGGLPPLTMHASCVDICNVLIDW